MNSTRGVAAIVVCCRNSSCNSPCDAIARNGRRTIALFLLFRVQQFVCNRLCEGCSKHVSSVVAAAKYCSLTPCQFHPFSKHPSFVSRNWLPSSGSRMECRFGSIDHPTKTCREGAGSPPLTPICICVERRRRFSYCLQKHHNHRPPELHCLDCHINW